MRGISLITLDLDDTLWPCEPVIRAAERALLQWLRREAPRLAREHNETSLREHRKAVSAVHPHLAHDITAIRHLSLVALLRQHGYAASLADEAMRLFLEVRNRVIPYPEVTGTLRRLRVTYRLVAVTNGNADVRQTPLGDFFHFAVSAAEAGASKPAPNVFYRALEWAGSPPGDAVHVGDDPVRDVDAARRIGMRTVWVNRNGAEWPAELPPADHSVTDLARLPLVLNAL